MRRSLRALRVGATLLAVSLAARGQTTTGAAQPPRPLNNPAPFAPAPALVSPGTLSMSLGAAERAHDLGFLSMAAAAYRDLLDDPGADTQGLTLALATVLLDADQAEEAEKLLKGLPEPHDAAWRLRAGLAALRLRRRAEAQAQWDAIKSEDISAKDRPWYNFFTGALYDTATPRDVQRANAFYVQAERGAPTELARARFQLAAERVRLREQGAPTKEAIDEAKRLFDRDQGREPGYEAARQYAVLLALSNRRDEAVKFLREQVLLGMPAQERAWRDEFHFMVGLLGDQSRAGVGRIALLDLVGRGVKVQRQRQALQVLTNASPRDPERTQLREELNKLIARTPPHPLRETLLYFRAQLALDDKDYATAEDMANRLLRDFPASPLRLHAFGLLTQSAWEQQRYRAAAASARSARASLPAVDPGQPDPAASARADLGVLEAEAFFRVREYRNAADAYAAVLRERSPALGGSVSGLMFQRVLAEIFAPSGDAAPIIDQYAADPDFKIDDRWQAEWALAQQLQIQGKTELAYARVGRLLAAQPGEDPRFVELNPELRARMGWLHAKLAADSDRFEPALQHLDSLLKALDGLTPALRGEIESEALLLRAQTELALKREAPAIATFKRLRDEYVQSEAALRSYLIESAYYEQQEKIPLAQQKLTELVDNPAYKTGPKPAYDNAPQFPYAYYQLALLSEKLGQERDLEEANRRLEQLTQLKTAADLMFEARMKQGAILQKRSDFPAAQRVFEFVVNNYAQRPDVVYALLALADCHSAQISTDTPNAPRHASAAESLYEQLRDRVDAPADVKVEAGYKRGRLLVQRGQPERAAQAWMADVIEPSPIWKEGAGRITLNDQQPYWLSRTLMELGALYETLEKIPEARKAYQLVLQARLDPAESVAKDALRRLGRRDPVQ